MSGSDRLSFVIQSHYSLFVLKDLKQILGSLKRKFAGSLDVIKEAGARSRRNLPDVRSGKNADGKDHHFHPLKLQALLQGEGSVIVQQARKKILLLKDELSGKEDRSRKFLDYRRAKFFQIFDEVNRE